LITSTTSLTEIEREKLMWLLGVLSGYKSLQVLYSEDKDVAAWHEGVQVERDVNRQQVNQYVTPYLIVAWAHDGRKREFDEFPAYVIVPRIGTAFRLRDFAVPSQDPGRANQLASEAIDLLISKATSLDGTKGENAMKHLRVLKRLYGKPA
jgi:hypothetical protein